MKLKDDIIIFSLIVLMYLVFYLSLCLQSANDRIFDLEEAINKIANRTTNDICVLSDTQSEVNDRLDDLEHDNMIQDLRLDLHHDILELHSQRFEDVVHEVNSFESAVENLTPSHISLPTTWTGNRLSRNGGVVNGPSGRETYYNMDMSFCISRMRSKGYSEKDYPYWVRDDGCKMLGPYIMVAANFKIRPLGTILETSLGWAIVVDTGGFVRQYPKGLDVATNW